MSAHTSNPKSEAFYRGIGEHYTPSITDVKDGPLVLDWPDDTPNTCIVAKEVLVEIVEQLNELRRLRVDHVEAVDACRYALADSPRWRECAETVVADYEQRSKP